MLQSNISNSVLYLLCGQTRNYLNVLATVGHCAKIFVCSNTTAAIMKPDERIWEYIVHTFCVAKHRLLSPVRTLTKLFNVLGVRLDHSSFLTM